MHLRCCCRSIEEKERERLRKQQEELERELEEERRREAVMQGGPHNRAKHSSTFVPGNEYARDSSLSPPKAKAASRPQPHAGAPDAARRAGPHGAHAADDLPIRLAPGAHQGHREPQPSVHKPTGIHNKKNLFRVDESEDEDDGRGRWENHRTADQARDPPQRHASVQSKAAIQVQGQGRGRAPQGGRGDGDDVGGGKGPKGTTVSNDELEQVKRQSEMAQREAQLARQGTHSRPLRE